MLALLQAGALRRAEWGQGDWLGEMGDIGSGGEKWSTSWRVLGEVDTI